MKNRGGRVKVMRTVGLWLGPLRGESVTQGDAALGYIAASKR